MQQGDPQVRAVLAAVFRLSLCISTFSSDQFGLEYGTACQAASFYGQLCHRSGRPSAITTVGHRRLGGDAVV